MVVYHRPPLHWRASTSQSRLTALVQLQKGESATVWHRSRRCSLSNTEVDIGTHYGVSIRIGALLRLECSVCLRSQALGAFAFMPGKVRYHSRSPYATCSCRLGRNVLCCCALHDTLFGMMMCLCVAARERWFRLGRFRPQPLFFSPVAVRFVHDQAATTSRTAVLGCHAR